MIVFQFGPFLTLDRLTLFSVEKRLSQEDAPHGKTAEFIVFSKFCSGPGLVGPKVNASLFDVVLFSRQTKEETKKAREKTRISEAAR